jgi:long-chain acyl-CoA synthetase
MSNPLDIWLAKAEAQNGKNIYWYKGDKKLSYQKLLDKVQRCHGWLLTIGAKCGDRLLLLTENDEELLPLLLGAWRTGMTVAIVDPKVTAVELTPILSDVEPQFIVGDKRHIGLVASDNFFEIKNKKVTKGLLRKLKKARIAETSTGYPDILETVVLPVESASVMPSDDALILFSSGTTGLPKGIVLSFHAIYSDVMAISKRMGYVQKHRIHNALPLYHSDGLIHGPLLVLINGATLVRSTPFSVTTIESYLSEMYRHNISHLISVPTILSFIHRNKGAFEGLFDWPEFDYVISTAGPLDATLWQRFQDDFNVRVCNVYGLTETTLAASISGPGDNSFRVGTVGKVLDGILLKVVDEQGNNLSTNETGEIVISGNILFSGYLNKSKQTAEILADGWIKTGDLGYIDGEGIITIAGRKKNTIIKGGENVSPEEVGACLLKHKAVLQAEVIGLPNRSWGESIAACIVVDSNSTSDADLMSHCNEQLSAVKLPDHFFYFKEFPVGPSGKVRRKQLIAMCQSEVSNRNNMDQVTSDVTEMIFRIAADVFKANKDDLSLESLPGNTLGWDSLAHLNVILTIEKELNVNFSVQEMMRMDSMKEIVNYANRKVVVG